MLINFSNHVSDRWSAEQKAAAQVYGDTVDVPFPEVDPMGDEGYIDTLAEKYAGEIAERSPSAVLCQGEMTLAFATAQKLTARGVTAIAACSKRAAEEAVDNDGHTAKVSKFVFVRFRKFSNHI